MLEKEFRLHPLALEDASRPHQRPKVERYTHHLFLVMYAVRLEGQELEATEIDAFLGERFLITVRKDPPFPVEGVLERWEAADELLKRGVGALLHGLLDAVVDRYVEVVDALEVRIEALEDGVLNPERDGQVQHDLFRLRKHLVTLRRVVAPLEEVVGILLRRDLVDLPDEILPYFQDIHDHLLRASASIESLQELLSSALQVHLSVVSNRLNSIMKRVTSWAAIIGVGTFIAGVYGMNFRLVPEDQSLFGFWFAVGLMLLSAAVLYIYFRRKDWL